MDNWELAGKISAQALQFGAKLIKINASIKDVIEKVEAKIIELGARPAFPVQVSINEIAAHFTINEDDFRFKENDLVKLDVGAHIDGAIGDNAITIDLGNNKELVKASELALKEAIKVVKLGTKVNEIGMIIEKTIKEFGFTPVRNLSGHSIEEYEEHAGMTIPNYDNKDETELEDGQVIAIEPFATNGIGLVEDGKLSNIYKIINLKPVRDNIAREILRFLAQEYKTLPFARRWLLKKFPSYKVNFGLRILERETILHHYSQLPEKSKGLVSQAEYTLLVKEQPKILTKAD